MTVFLLAMAALVVVILLSRLSPPARWVERRSVQRYEHSMDVLRSLPSRRIAAHPAEQAVLAPPPAAPRSPERPAVVDVGGNGFTPAKAGEEHTTPALVFVADDAGGDAIERDSSLPGATSIEDPTPSLGERLGAFVAAVSSTIGRPRVRITAGLTTVVVGATIAGTLLSLTSASPRSQRVRQVSSVPVKEAPPPSSTIPPTPSSTEETPPTTAVPAQPDTQTIEPTATTPTPTTPPTPPSREVVEPPPDVSPAEPPSPVPTFIVPTPPPTMEPPSTSSTVPPTTTTPRGTTTTPPWAAAVSSLISRR